MSESPRLARLRERISTEGAGGIALTHVPNLFYATGFAGVFDEEPAHIALVTPDQAVIFTDSRYFEAMAAASEGGPWEVRLVTDSLGKALAEEVAAQSLASVALETSQPYARFKALSSEVGAEIVEASGWVEALRAVKDEAEIESIDAAQQLTDWALDFLIECVRPGKSERDVALELEFFMRREGADGVAFPPIVASGPNSARPHWIPGDRRLETGDIVLLDYGARVDGYCADMTRTLVIGPATERQREVYDAVLAANEAGAAAARVGVAGKDVDAAARAVLEERGFGEYFGHGLGHGVGLEVHELPNVGTRSEAPLEAGSVITIEPGVYIPGFGGVRIEDLAVVEESGVRILTRSTKELLEL
jgi:Xaa-Pro aminopeptidase